MLQKIDLKSNPYLIRLKKEEEEISDLLKLPKEELLLRWFNYHLANAKHPTKVGNFSKDISNGNHSFIPINTPRSFIRNQYILYSIKRAIGLNKYHDNLIFRC